MTKEQEAQQAQTIDRYIIDHTGVLEQPIESPIGEFVLYADHKAMVDSQAQKIVSLQEKVDYLNGAIEKSEDERAKTIMEQAKEIERLKQTCPFPEHWTGEP